MVLQWLWTDVTRWADVLKQDIRLSDTLCFFLVAEGRQEYILGLIRAEQPASVDLAPRWRGLVLRSLVRAQMFNIIGGCADPALDLFFLVRDATRSLQRGAAPPTPGDNSDAYSKTSLWPASVELCAVLSRGEYPKTSPAKYDEFVHEYRRLMRWKEGDARWSIACLALHNPGQPDPDPLLEYLTEIFPEDSRLSTENTMPSSVVSRAQFSFICQELRTILERQNRTEDTTWVDELSRFLFNASEEATFYRRQKSAPHGGSTTSKVRRYFKAYPSDHPSSWTHERTKSWRSQKDEE